MILAGFIIVQGLHLILPRQAASIIHEKNTNLALDC